MVVAKGLQAFRKIQQQRICRLSGRQCLITQCGSTIIGVPTGLTIINRSQWRVFLEALWQIGGSLPMLIFAFGITTFQTDRESLSEVTFIIDEQLACFTVQGRQAANIRKVFLLTISVISFCKSNGHLFCMADTFYVGAYFWCVPGSATKTMHWQQKVLSRLFWLRTTNWAKAKFSCDGIIEVFIHTSCILTPQANVIVYI